MQIIPTETEKNKAIYEIVTEICITQQATGRGSLMLRFCQIWEFLRKMLRLIGNGLGRK